MSRSGQFVQVSGSTMRDGSVDTSIGPLGLVHARFSAALLALTVANGCGAATASAPEPASEPRSRDDVVAEPSAESDDSPSNATRAEAEPAASAPDISLPPRTARDEATRLVAVHEGTCTVRAVADGSVFVEARSADASTLARWPADGPWPTHPVWLHRARANVEYRVGHGHVALLEHLPGFGTADLAAFRIPEPANSEAVEPIRIARQAHISTWALEPAGVLFGDSSYTHPHLARIEWSGGEPTSVETLRSVLDEDRIEQLSVDGNEAFFVAVRTRSTGGGGYVCHELRGGPIGSSRTLRAPRRCPNDEELLSVLALDATHVYYFRDEGFYRVPRAPSGRAREEAVLPRLEDVPTTAATDGRYLVWTESRGLMRAALGSSAAPEQIGEPARTLGPPHIAEGRVYWSRREPSGSCLVLVRPLDAPALTP